MNERKVLLWGYGKILRPTNVLLRKLFFIHCCRRCFQVEETVYDRAVKCHHSYQEKCHMTYITDYRSVTEEKCETTYDKNCHIVFKPMVTNYKCYLWPLKKLLFFNCLYYESPEANLLPYKLDNRYAS